MFAGRASVKVIEGWPDWAIISIGEPNIENNLPLSGWSAVHRVDVWDVEREDKFQTISNEQANDIVAFVKAQAENPKINGVFVNCKAGVSRSAAVARWICETYDIPFNQQNNTENRLVYQRIKSAGSGRESTLISHVDVDVDVDEAADELIKFVAIQAKYWGLSIPDYYLKCELNERTKILKLKSHYIDTFGLSKIVNSNLEDTLKEHSKLDLDRLTIVFECNNLQYSVKKIRIDSGCSVMPDNFNTVVLKPLDVGEP